MAKDKSEELMLEVEFQTGASALRTLLFGNMFSFPPAINGLFLLFIV